MAAASPDEGTPASQSSEDRRDAQADSGGKHRGHGQGHQDDKGRSDNHGDGGEGTPEEESLELVVSPEGAANQLEWTFHGRRERVKSFDVYRSINEGPVQLIGSLSANDQSFTDQDLQQAGTYSYFVTATDSDGSRTTTSNRQIVLVTCNWLSVSPFGDPPILFNQECSPLRFAS